MVTNKQIDSPNTPQQAEIAEDNSSYDYYSDSYYDETDSDYDYINVTEQYETDTNDEEIGKLMMGHKNMNYYNPNRCRLFSI